MRRACWRARESSDTARFWASRVVREADGKRHIRHVIGPNEYHEDVDDNAFTNMMARWNIKRALETMELLRAAALWKRLTLSDDELDDWRDAVARIVIGLDSATGPAFMSNSPAFMHLNRD
jgi:trehalose/maltose hydrolase-like predicted phosphorylase